MNPSSAPFHLHRIGTSGKPKGLWLHGFLGDGAEGENFLDPLLNDYEILCPDLPGHGKTDPMSLSDTLSGIAKLAAGCDFSAGYSMGGRLLMMSASRHPNDFRHLILESAFLGHADAEERSERRQVDAQRAEKLRKEGLEAFCTWWYAQPMWQSLPAPPLRHGNAAHLATALETFSAGTQPDLRPWLMRCTSRILWLAGERDSRYVEQARWVKQHIGGAQVRLIPGCGHNIHLEDPEAWQSAVQEFLQQLHLEQHQQEQ
ncbi:MAG: alpha/beta fold hydrolase [Verrucomicrobia bacterium]|nr:alpha/beta fold hydrolase [Verrucomicrobiota bacterium]MCH8514079.1 alpha/beta fold hydrolase [Kiritimatiellia bacterium]